MDVDMGSMCHSLAAQKYIEVSYSHACMKTERKSMSGDCPLDPIAGVSGAPFAEPAASHGDTKGRNLKCPESIRSQIPRIRPRRTLQCTVTGRFAHTIYFGVWDASRSLLIHCMSLSAVLCTGTLCTGIIH